jgi:hypothetical protein
MRTNGRAGDDGADDLTSGADYKVGYRRPPRRNEPASNLRVHANFPTLASSLGVSGNPSGRRKGSKNIRSIFEQILSEISLRDGGVTKKITKAEATVRALVHGAIKGESSSQQNLFRLAQQIGQFEEKPEPLQAIQRVIVSWLPSDQKPGRKNRRMSQRTAPSAGKTDRRSSTAT